MNHAHQPPTRDKLMQFSPNIERGEAIEIVTVAFLRWLEHNRNVRCADVANVVAGGNRWAVTRLLSREIPSLAMAQRIVDAYPEIGLDVGEPLVCNRCGRLPHLPRAAPMLAVDR